MSRLFNIRAEEWPRVIVLFAMMTITNTGAIWGLTISYAALLEQLGLGALPWIFALSAVFSIAASIIYTIFVDRIINTTLFIIIYALGILSILFGLGLLWLDLPKIAYPLLYLLLLAWVTVYNPHFITYINTLYDTQAAKRILPVVSAGDRIGAIVGGVTMALLIRVFSHNVILIMWLLTYLIAMALIGVMPYFIKNKIKSPGETLAYANPPRATPSGSQFSLFIESMKDGFRYTLQSPYLRWIAAGTLLLMVLMTLLEYETSGILLDIYGTSEKLANFLARLVSIGNIIALPLLLLAISRLIGRLGVSKASMIFPTGNFLVCAALILAPGWTTAVLAYFNRTVFQSVFQSPIDGLLFNAVPMRVKGRARAFISGLIVPLGSLIGGLLLFLPLTSRLWFTASLIGILALSYFISAWFTRQQYSRALVKMLEQEDYSFMLSQEATKLMVTDPKMLTQLQIQLESSTSHEITVFMAQLMSQIGGRDAIPILDQAVRKAESPHTRAAIVDVIIAADLRNDKIHQLYTDLLTDPAGEVRESALTGLQQISSPGDSHFLSQALQMIQDPHINVQELALSILARAGNFYDLAPAVEMLNVLLTAGDSYRRVYGVRVLGQIGDEQSTHRLLNCLTDPADEVRLEAILALEMLSRQARFNSTTGAELEQKARALLKDPVERVRQAALIILGQIKQRSAYQAVADALSDLSPQIRATATDVLVQAAKAAIPIVHPKLDAPDSQVRKMAAVTLSRIDPKEFGSLIVGTYVTGNLLSIYRNYGLVEALDVVKAFPSTLVMQSALRERSQQLADEIFYLLGAIYDPATVRIINESLKSDSLRARANASEALESLTTPKTANLITPLFDPHTELEQLRIISQETWDMEQPNASQALQYLITQAEDPWLRAMTAFTLGEIGATLAAILPAEQIPFTLQEIETMLTTTLADPAVEVRQAAHTAQRLIAGIQLADLLKKKEGIMLSAIEKIIFLKEVPFFQSMTIDQLKVLASVCEEEVFEEDQRIFNNGDPGGVIYVVVNGRVGIEQEKRAGSFARLATIQAHSYFGEANFFDNSPRSTSAIAIQDTLTLRLRREPLIALARQHPDMSLALINVLSERLREANDRIADLTRSRPRQLNKLFDQYD